MHSINTLPEEVLIHLFEFLNLYDRKHAMLVCKYWFELLNLPKFSDDCIWIFYHCSISPDKKPFNVFQKCTPGRKFLRIDLGMESCIKDKIDFFNFLGFIGKETTHLSVSEYFIWTSKLTLHEILQYFPKLENLKCNIALIESHSSLPQTLKNLYLPSTPRKIKPKDASTLKDLLQRNNLNITIDSVYRFYDDKGGVELFNYDPQVVEIAKEMFTIQVEKRNFKEDDDKIGFSDVLSLHIVEISLPISSHKDYLRFFTHLKNVSYQFFEDLPNGCWFGHEILNHPTLERLSISYNSVLDPCEECNAYFLKSFANLTKVEVSGIQIKLEDILNSHWSLKEITFSSYTCLPLKWSNLPPKTFLKMKNLTKLDLVLQQNQLNPQVIQKLPKMPKLLNLLLRFDASTWEFENLDLLTRICPNLRSLSVVSSSTYNSSQIASLFQHLPYLKVLSIENFDFSNAAVRQFADNACGYAKNLRYLYLFCYSREESEDLNKYKDTEEGNYLQKMIPTLRLL